MELVFLQFWAREGNIVTVSLCVTMFFLQLVAWAIPVVCKPKNDKLKMSYESGCLHRPVIFEVEGMKKISIPLQPAKEAPTLPAGILM